MKSLYVVCPALLVTIVQIKIEIKITPIILTKIYQMMQLNWWSLWIQSLNTRLITQLQKHWTSHGPSHMGNRYRSSLLLNSMEGSISRRSSKRINGSELIRLNSNKFAHLVGHSVHPHDSMHEQREEFRVCSEKFLLHGNKK